MFFSFKQGTLVLLVDQFGNSLKSWTRTYMLDNSKVEHK